VADGGAATFYVDAGQLTQTAVQEPFYPGTGANSLWHAVNDALEERAVPNVTIDVDVLDFYRQDPASWPDAQLVLGVNVNAGPLTRVQVAITNSLEPDDQWFKEVMYVLPARPNNGIAVPQTIDPRGARRGLIA